MVYMIGGGEMNGKENDVKLLAKFEELVEVFDEDDEIIVEDVNIKMHECFKQFLDVGFNANQVTKMLSPEDVFENYDFLVSKGAVINVTDLANKLWKEACDDEFFRSNYEWFLIRGIDIETLVHYCSAYACDFLFDNYRSLHETYGIDNGELSKVAIVLLKESDELSSWTIQEYLDSGLDAKVLLEQLLKEDLGGDDYLEEHMLEFCSAFHTCGVSADLIEKLLDHVNSDFVFYMMIQHEYEEWASMGVNCSKYADGYVSYALDYSEIDEDCHRLEVPDSLMDCISKSLLKKLTMQEIMDSFDDAEYFIDGCVRDVKLFGKKFIDEGVKYEDEPNAYYWMYMILASMVE